MSGRKETGESFLYVNSFFTQKIIQKTQVRMVAWNIEIKPGCEVLDSERGVGFGRRSRLSRLRAYLFGRLTIVAARASLLEMFENGQTGGQRQRVAHKSSCKESYSNLRNRIVAVLPHSAVKGIHEFCPACQNADGHSAANHFSITDKSARISNRACIPPWCDRKPVTTSSKISAVPASPLNTTDFVQEFDWPECGMTTLNRLDKNGCKLRDVLANIFQRFGRP